MAFCFLDRDAQIEGVKGTATQGDMVESRLLGGATDGLLAFGIACVGTLVGTVMAWLLLGARLGADGWKVCIFCG